MDIYGSHISRGSVQGLPYTRLPDAHSLVLTHSRSSSVTNRGGREALWSPDPPRPDNARPLPGVAEGRLSATSAQIALVSACFTVTLNPTLAKNCGSCFGRGEGYMWSTFYPFSPPLNGISQIAFLFSLESLDCGCGFNRFTRRISGLFAVGFILFDSFRKQLWRFANKIHVVFALSHTTAFDWLSFQEIK